MIENAEDSSSQWEQRKKSLEEERQKIVPGFNVAAPRYASAPGPLSRTAQETALATFRQGATGSFFYGYQSNPDAIADLDFDVTEYMRPQDYQYAAQAANMPNLEEWQRFQAAMDARDADYQTISARPWVSGLSTFLDPGLLAIDMASFGLGHAVTIPLIANTLGATRLGVRATEVLAQSSRAAKVLEQSAIGAQAGATSVYAQEKIKSINDSLHHDDELGSHVFMGSVIGMALGGAVGLIGKTASDKIKEEFIQGFKVGQDNARPPPFMGPPKPTPADRGILSTGKKPDVRGQLNEETVPKTREQIKTEAEALKLSVEIGETQRAGFYQQLRNNFKQIGENLVKNTNLPTPIKKVISLISYPIRNLSATNRALSSPFGSARLFAISMARNATEFLGTREGLVLPRSAQNRIEDITNQALDMSLELYQIYMKANGIEPGKFASEKLAFGKRLLDETQFFEDVGNHMLHIGKPSEANFIVNPYVKQAAKLVYDKIYKPFGDLLKEYKLISPESSVDEVLNYLNREWKNQNLLANPEGFKNWLAGFYEEQNEKLKSILPNYNERLKFARKMKTDARRFERASEKIQQLQSKINKNYADEIQNLESENAMFINSTEEKYNLQRDAIESKYQDIGSEEQIPDVKTTKKILRDEIKEARAERDKLTSEFDSKINDLNLKLKDLRAKLNQKIRDIKSGKKDGFIKSEYLKANAEQIRTEAENLMYLTKQEKEYSPEMIDILAEEISGELDAQHIKQMRGDLIAEEKFLASVEAEKIEEARRILKSEKKKVLNSQSKNIDKLAIEATNLIEEESKLAGKKSQEGAIQKLIEARKKLELKVIDLKEAKEIALHEKDVARKMAEIQAPVERIEYLQKKYSRAGLISYAERKQSEAAAKDMRKFGATEENIKRFLKEARARERKAIENAPIKNEASILSNELMEGYTQALNEAEEMIPWDLRSSKTGRPYSVWDKTESPEMAYDLAEKTFYTMIGQEDEIVTNPVLSILSGSQNAQIFKPRALKMPDDYPGIEQWVERDIRFLMNNFVSGVAPPIALTETMIELNKLPIIQQTVKRMQVLNPSIGPVKALNMPSEMQHFTEIPSVLLTMLREEFRLMSRGLKGEELQNLEKLYKKAERDMGDLDKQIKGIFQNGMNVNSKNASDFVDLFNSWTSTTTNNNLSISMMGDLITSSLRYGFKDYIFKGLLPLLRSPELYQMSKAELQAMMIAMKVGQGTILKNRISGRKSSLKNSYLGTKISNFANRIGNYTGANAMANFTEIVNGVLIKNNLLEMAERVANGTITQKELTYLAQRSTSKEQALAIYNLFKKYGWKKDGVRGIDPSNIINPTPDELKAFSYYQNFVNDDLRTVVARPGVGSLANYAYTPTGKSILYLKKWFMAATNDTFIPAVQRADKEAVQGFAMLFAIGALQSKIRQLYRSEEQKEFNIEGFISEALTNAGILGIYTFGLDAALASGIIAGNGGARYDPMNGIANLIVGPGVIGSSERVLNIMGRMRKIMTDEDRQFNYKDLNYILSTGAPMYRWAPISSVVKPNLREYFDSMGRLE